MTRLETHANVYMCFNAGAIDALVCMRVCQCVSAGGGPAPLSPSRAGPCSVLVNHFRLQLVSGGTGRQPRVYRYALEYPLDFDKDSKARLWKQRMLERYLEGVEDEEGEVVIFDKVAFDGDCGLYYHTPIALPHPGGTKRVGRLDLTLRYMGELELATAHDRNAAPEDRNEALKALQLICKQANIAW
eukprot:GHVU01113670.1.p5 GENE.GHVU01113670.1~~GHVU01113670.1.p5  ORF type:complete len:187 (+),score=28.34 GHVU01113670.1:81-641(+)